MRQKVNSLLRFSLTLVVFFLFSGNSIHAFSYTWDSATGTLTINVTNQSGENITVCLCSGGAVQINGDWLKDAIGNYIYLPATQVNKLIINGGAGKDVIDLDCVSPSTYPNLAKTGSEFKVQVNGGDGPDEIRGSHHADLINVGSGDDYVVGQKGDDEIWGGGGADELYGCEGNDTINGEVGDDYIEGEEGNDTINGGDGRDEIYGGFYDGTVSGSDDDTIHGGADNDLIYGCEGNDTIYGEAGNDFIAGEEGNDIIDGGEGNDELYGAYGDGASVNGPDNDIIHGGPGNDLLYGSGGSDELYGDDSNDTLDLDFEDMVTDGGAGDDKIVAPKDLFKTSFINSPRTLTITDSAGEDQLDFTNAFRGVSLDLDLQSTSQPVNNEGYNLKLNGRIENFIGSPFDDILRIKPLTNFTQNIDGGANTNGDVLNFDAMGKVTINDGVCLTCEGYMIVLHSNFEIVNILNPPTKVETEQNLPTEYSLSQNYPNPFNPTTTIRYQLPEGGRTLLKVYNLLGKEMASLIDKEQPAGNHEISFDASQLPSGVYFYRIQVNGFTQTKTMMILK